MSSKFTTPKVTDENITSGHAIYDKYHRDRYDYDRQALLADVIKAYRLNPLIRRIVRIYRQFAIGSNLTIELKPALVNSHVPADKKFARAAKRTSADFIHEFWRHPINDLDEQVPEWFDERTLTGNLFILFTVDPSGMPLVRAIPTETITAIITKDNDYRQETAYKTGVLDEVTYQAYDPNNPNPPFVRHYVINRPVGATFGESDMFPLLPWVSRFTAWLEARASLNYYRSFFAWVLSGNFTSEADRKTRENEIRANPPKPNSILVKNESETWDTLSPKLDSFEAGADGLAIKKHIAAGAGIPMHYLAEPESATRTTAEAAGTPTFRNFQDYQQSFYNILRDVLSVACALRRQVDTKVPANPEFIIRGADISERDNTLLALALQRGSEPVAELYDRKMISAAEYLRLAYKFAGEVYDEDQPTPEGLRRPLSNRPKSLTPTPPIKVDPDSGDVTEQT